jgi:hypothetical protein
LHGGRSPVRKNIKEIQQRVAKGKKEKNGSEFIFGMASVMNTFEQNCIDNMHWQKCIDKNALTTCIDNNVLTKNVLTKSIECSE